MAGLGNNEMNLKTGMPWSVTLSEGSGIAVERLEGEQQAEPMLPCDDLPR